MVVAEGELGHNGVFKVHALGFPPVEARAKSLAVAKARSAPDSTGCGRLSLTGHAELLTSTAGGDTEVFVSAAHVS